MGVSTTFILHAAAKVPWFILFLCIYVTHCCCKPESALPLLGARILLRLPQYVGLSMTGPCPYPVSYLLPLPISFLAPSPSYTNLLSVLEICQHHFQPLGLFITVLSTWNSVSSCLYRALSLSGIYLRATFITYPIYNNSHSSQDNLSSQHFLHSTYSYLKFFHLCSFIIISTPFLPLLHLPLEYKLLRTRTFSELNLLASAWNSIYHIVGAH